MSESKVTSEAEEATSGLSVGGIDGLADFVDYPDESRLKRWVLITGGRLRVMLLLMAAVFVGLVALALSNPVELKILLSETGTAQTLFSALLSGAILLVSIVVSINSVVLSQEITDLENQRERIDASIRYHQQIQEYMDEEEITPARPADFLNAVLYATAQQVHALVQVAQDSDSEAFREDVEQLADQIATDVEDTRSTLAETELGTFRVLLAGLNYNFSRQLQAVRGLQYTYADELDEEQEKAVEALTETIKHIGTGREYFKSLYYKREFARLSSRMLYVALPVIILTSYVLLALGAHTLPMAPVFGLPSRLIPLAVAYSVALAPYIILTAYIMRSATISLRTLSSGPFILQGGSDVEALDWEVPDASQEWEVTDKLADD